MVRFHELKVIDIQRETRDAVTLTLEPRDEDRERFKFIQGQYLTFRRNFDGAELRRSYSICSGVDDNRLRVGIKRVEGGAFSTWVNESLVKGEILEAMPPMGHFHLPIDPESRRRYLCFAAGSGITPILSIVKTVLAQEPQSEIVLVYSNRQVNSIMFREEIEDLKNIFLGRLTVLHILTSKTQEADLFTGRIDAAKCDALFSNWIDPAVIDFAFICGPEQMMLDVAKSLRAHGMRDDQIKFELFASSQPGRVRNRLASATPHAGTAITEVSITLDGATSHLKMARQDQCLLDVLLENHMDAPYSCRAGVCSTCRAKVIEGEFEMAVNHALEEYEIQQGYVLTCQCYPLSDSIAVTYDQ